MPNILIAWELGGGLGHVGPLRAVGAELVRRGHTVLLATGSSNLPLGEQALAGSGVQLLEAPQVPLSQQQLKYPCTYTDLLHDCGYANAEHLTSAVDAWRHLFEQVQPQVPLAGLPSSGF